MDTAGDTGLLQDIHRLDILAFGWCHRRSAEAMVFIAARWISRSADGWLYLLLALLFLATGAIDAAPFITLGSRAFALERTVYLLMKNTCRRRRPPDILPGFRSLVIASDRFSFPSGHTSAAFLFAGLCTQEFGVWAALLLYSWACCVGASRVFLGVHSPSDAAAGAILGSALLLAAATVFAA
jgi:undecaprenyl-diphosphatase